MGKKTKLTFDTAEKYIEAINDLKKKKQIIDERRKQIVADEHLYREKMSIGLSRIGAYHQVPLKWADTVFCDPRYKNRFLKQNSCTLNDIQSLIPDYEYHTVLYIEGVFKTYSNTYTVVLSDPYDTITATDIHIEDRAITDYEHHIAYCTIVKRMVDDSISEHTISVKEIHPKSYGLYGYKNETSVAERDKKAKANEHPIYNAFAEVPETALGYNCDLEMYGLSLPGWYESRPRLEQYGKTVDTKLVLWVPKEGIKESTVYTFKYCTVCLTPISAPYVSSPNERNNVKSHKIYATPDAITEGYAPYCVNSPDPYGYGKDNVERYYLQEFREIITYKDLPNYLSDEELQYFVLKYAKENFADNMNEVDAMRAINNIEHYVSASNIEKNEKNLAIGYGSTVPMMDRTTVTMDKIASIERFTWGGEFKDGYPYFDIKEVSPTECRILVSCIQRVTPSEKGYFAAVDAKLRYLLRDDLFSAEKRNEFLKNDITNQLERMRKQAISNKDDRDYERNNPEDEEEYREFLDFVDEDAKIDYYHQHRYGIDAPSYRDVSEPHKKDPLALMFRRLPYKMITIKYDKKRNCLTYAESTQFYYNSMRPVLAAKYDRETIDRIGGEFYFSFAKLPCDLKGFTGHDDTRLNRFIFLEYMKEITDFTFWFYDKYIMEQASDETMHIPEKELEDMYRILNKMPADKKIEKDLSYSIWREYKIREIHYDSYSDAAAKVLDYGETHQFMLCGDFSTGGPFGSDPKWLRNIPEQKRRQFYDARKAAGLDSFDKYLDSYMEMIGYQDKYLEEFKKFDTKYGLIDYVPFVANLKKSNYNILIERIGKEV